MSTYHSDEFGQPRRVRVTKGSTRRGGRFKFLALGVAIAGLAAGLLVWPPPHSLKAKSAATPAPASATEPTPDKFDLSTTPRTPDTEPAP